MNTLRVRNPIPLHTSVFLKNTGSYRLISGPWHNSFHTVVIYNYDDDDDDDEEEEEDDDDDDCYI